MHISGLNWHNNVNNTGDWIPRLRKTVAAREVRIGEN
jgi:hypothetical protein